MEMRCKKCGYDLRGLEECRCPECGQAFNPGNAGTYLTKPVSGTRFVKLALLALVLFSMPQLFSLLLDMNMISVRGLPKLFLILLGPLMLISGIVISWYVVEQGWKALGGKMPWIENRRGFSISLIICGAIYFGFIAHGLYLFLSRW